MYFEDLKKSAKTYAYQLRKNFPEDESPIGHYVCDNEVVVISTKKLYIFYYYSTFVDYLGDKYSKIKVSNIDLEKYKCTILLQKKLFELQFFSRSNLEYLIKYIDKYK